VQTRLHEIHAEIVSTMKQVYTVFKNDGPEVSMKAQEVGDNELMVHHGIVTGDKLFSICGFVVCNNLKMHFFNYYPNTVLKINMLFVSAFFS
jgi:hypothetical protein